MDNGVKVVLRGRIVRFAQTTVLNAVFEVVFFTFATLIVRIEVITRIADTLVKHPVFEEVVDTITSKYIILENDLTKSNVKAREATGFVALTIFRAGIALVVIIFIREIGYRWVKF